MWEGRATSPVASVGLEAVEFLLRSSLAPNSGLTDAPAPPAAFTRVY